MATPRHFVVCIQNEGYEESLEPRKIYEVLEDRLAEERGFLRVVDEDGESYLYPKGWFVPIQLPHEVEDTFLDRKAS